MNESVCSLVLWPYYKTNAATSSWVSSLCYSLSEMNVSAHSDTKADIYLRLGSWGPTAAQRWPVDAFPSWICKARMPMARPAGQRGCWSRCLETTHAREDMRAGRHKVCLWTTEQLDAEKSNWKDAVNTLLAVIFLLLVWIIPTWG